MPHIAPQSPFILLLRLVNLKIVHSVFNLAFEKHNADIKLSLSGVKSTLLILNIHFTPIEEKSELSGFSEPKNL